MTNEEKIAKMEEMFTKYVDWVNHWYDTEYRVRLGDVKRYGTLMLWLDYNYKEEADKIGREVIWDNFQRCVTVETPDYGDLSAWTD